MVQDDEVGDGTTSVTVLACELLKVYCNVHACVLALWGGGGGGGTHTSFIFCLGGGGGRENNTVNGAVKIPPASVVSKMNVL